MRISPRVVLAAALVLLLAGCTNLFSSHEKTITSFSFVAPATTGTVNESLHTIVLTLPFRTEVTALVPIIAYDGASISPKAGSTVDFTNPVIYTVTAADSTTQAYVVTVLFGDYIPPSAPELLWNGDFELGNNFWHYFQQEGANGQLDFPEGNFILSGNGSRGQNPWDIVLFQDQIVLERKAIYRVRIKARSTASTDRIAAYLQEGAADANGDGHGNTTWESQDLLLDTTMGVQDAILTMPDVDDPTGQLLLDLGKTTGIITIESISMEKIGLFVPPAAPELVSNGDFSLGGTAWTPVMIAPAIDAPIFSNGVLSLPGTSHGDMLSDIQLRADNTLLAANTKYRITFDASSTDPSDYIYAYFTEGNRDTNGDGTVGSWLATARVLIGPVLANYYLDLSMPSFDATGCILVFMLGNTKGNIVLDNISMKPLHPMDAIVTDFLTSMPSLGLRTAIEEKLGSNFGAIRYSDLASLETLSASNRTIDTIAGIEFCPNLKELYLDRNQVADLSPLQGLLKLEALSLVHNPITSLAPLYALNNLTQLFVQNSNLGEEAVAFVTNDRFPMLTTIGFGGRSIDDIQVLTAAQMMPIVAAVPNLTSVSVPRFYDLGGAFFVTFFDTVLSPRLGTLSLLNIGNSNITNDNMALLAACGGVLKTLNVWGNETFTDLSRLNGLSALSYLGIESTGVSDLSPLLELYADGCFHDPGSAIDLQGLNLDLRPGTSNRAVLDELANHSIELGFADGNITE